MNENTEYEKLAKDICERLSKSRSITLKRIEHNVHLIGKSGQKHQIDVYWEFEKHGKLYKVAIECKNYKTRISIAKVRDFFGVLYDLDNIKGIMITKEGYQRGAKKYAACYGIALKELRDPIGNENIIGKTYIALDINVRHTLFHISEEYAQMNNINTAAIAEIQNFYASMEDPQPEHPKDWTKSRYLPLEILNRNIYDADEKVISTIDELAKGVIKGEDKIIPFDNAFVQTRKYGKVMIDEIKFEFEHDVQEKIIELDAEGFVDKILKDALNDKSIIFMKDFRKQ